MKPAKVGRETEFLNEIIETLKAVPRTRLRIVRDVVEALSERPEASKDGVNSKRRGRKSLLKTPFCGMWQGRRDIGNGRSYASSLRQRLERRGDRT